MHTVDIEAVTIKVPSHFLAGYSGRKLLFASLIFFLFSIVLEILSEKRIRDRIFYGIISRIFIMWYFNCYECWSTVYFSNADMVGNILVSYGMPVENVSSSLLLVELYCVIEGNANDGTAENTVFKVGISYLVFVSRVNP